MRSFLGKKESSANAEDEKKEKKNVGIEARTRDLNLAVHRSTHYSIPPSVHIDIEIEYIKKTKNIFFKLQKKL